ncbi:MAG: 50S ribosomal protein L25 [Planctomycetes bacterium]|nr:50S ribosomal protein L25 [Planctomycetota bacterium]
MSMNKLQVHARSERGSNAVRRLRAGGFVPAVLYGLHREPHLLKIRGDDLAGMLREGNRMVDLALDDQVQAALLKDLQFDSLGERVLHADFVRVDLAETLRIKIPIRYVGVAKGQAAGGLVDHRLSELEVECLPGRIPEQIEVPVRDLDVGQSIHVRELHLPEGVTCPLNPETVVVAVTVMVEKVEKEAAAVPEAEAAEPEIIVRKDRPDEEGQKG